MGAFSAKLGYVARIAHAVMTQWRESRRPQDRLPEASMSGHHLLEHEAPLVGTERPVCLSLPHGGHRALRPVRVGEGRRVRRRHPRLHP